MKRALNRLFRFFSIDSNYLSLPLPLGMKVEAVLKTDLAIFLNVLLHKQKGSITIHNTKIYYDTQFATKTFLAAEQKTSSK